MSSPSGAPKPNQDPGYELGDLELAPMPLRPSLQTTHRPGAPGARMDDSDDQELTIVDSRAHSLPGEPANDDLDGFQRGNHHNEHSDSSGYGDFGEDHSFELDLPKSDRPGNFIAASKRPSLQTAPSAPARASKPARSGSPRDEERAARELADYGDPDSGFGAPGYVLRVAARWFALYSTRRQIEQRASELADAYEQALRDLGRALLDDHAVVQHEALRDRVLLVQTRQGELQRAEEATEAARAQVETELHAIKQKSAALEAELAPFQAAESAALAAQAKHEAELKRRKAKVQRAEIELRAMTRASMPPPPERVHSVEADRAQQQSEIDVVTANLAEATAALGRARRELALRRGTLDGAGREHSQHQQAAHAQSREFEEAVGKAEHLLSAALCGLAEAAETLGLGHSANEQIDGLRASEAALDQVVDELAKYDRALTLYDRSALLKGSAMWLALVVVLAVIVRVW